MNIGFIGAGKVGVSLGKYLTERGMTVTGYYSKSRSSASMAAEFTDTRAYDKLEDLVEDSDGVFLTVPDREIAGVWEQIKRLPIKNKIFSHFSGVFSSNIFSDISRYHAYGYSIHPLFAIHDKYHSYKELSHAFFTIEGDDTYLDQMVQIFRQCKNSVEIIRAEDKIRYHAAAAMVSNLYVGLVSMGEAMLTECGFSKAHAHEALVPLMVGNAKNIAACGVTDALTGPVERNDLSTVKAHLAHLSEEEAVVYKSLSLQVLLIAQKKHTERNYDPLKEVLTS